jgi:hypothetical protein
MALPFTSGEGGLMSAMNVELHARTCRTCGAVSPFVSSRLETLCADCRAEAERVRATSEALLLEGGAAGETLAATADVALLREGK